MQSILDAPTQVEAISNQRQSSNFGAVAQQVNWLATIENLFSGLLLLLPFFFLPITADPLNLNKAYLTIVVALLALVLFFASGVQKGSLSISNVKAYLGLSVLALAAIASVIFSLNRANSIFGHFGNYTDSLLFIISLFIIGFIASNMKFNVRKLVLAFVGGVSISTVVSLLVLYGVALPGIGELPRAFSLAGSVYILMGLQIIAVLVSLFYLLNPGTLKGRVVHTAVLLVNGLYLLALLNGSALITLAFGLIFLFLYVKKDVSADSKKILIGLIVALSALGFVHHYPMTRDALGLNQVNTQPRLSIKESWFIVAETLRDYPITGSGIGTFVNVFSLYRPASLNMTENWQARFESPYSDAFLWLGNAGLLGLFAYIAFIAFALNTVKSLDQSNDTTKLLMVIIPVALLALILLGNNPLIYVLLFVALGIAIQRSRNGMTEIRSVPVLSIFAIAAIALFGYTMFNGYKVYAGQYLFRESLFKDNLGERFQLQARAIQADQSESVYQRSYISTGIAIASVLAQKEDLTDEEKQEIVNILSQSFNNVRYITESFEPFNVANWSLRGDLYASVMDLAEGADQLAVTSYRNGIQLEGTNPNLWINLGSVYYRRQVYGEAISAFLQAVQLKPDYANARYNLAYALKDAGYLADAVTQMEIVTRLVPQGTPDFEKATSDLEEFRKLADEAAAAQQAESPEGVSEVNTQPESAQTSSEPLVAPEDQPPTQLDTNAGIEEEVSEIVTPSADGSEVPEGGTEAPIANPQ